MTQEARSTDTVVLSRLRKVSAPDSPTWERYVELGEKVSHHRAFLLWAMQDPDKRSGKRVAVGMNRRDNVIWTWSKRWKWADRVAIYGLSSQARAIQAYKKLYQSTFSLHEIAMVEQNMSVPFATFSPPPDEDGMGDAARLAVRHTLEEGDDKAGSPIPSRNDPAARAQAVLRKGLLILEAAITRYGKAIASDKDARALIRKMDPARMMREYRELTTTLGDLTPAQANGVALEPSYRVQLARRRGESIVTAMREDAEEAFSVLRALAAAEAVAASTGAPKRDPDAGEEEIDLDALKAPDEA